MLQNVTSVFYNDYLSSTKNFNTNKVNVHIFFNISPALFCVAKQWGGIRVGFF